MKKISLIFLLKLSTILIYGQVIGNGNRITKSKDLPEIDKIIININGEINIFSGLEENSIDITYDENIVDLVGTGIIGNSLVIDQLKWIEGKQDVIANIYVKDIDSIENDSWSKVTVNNLNQNRLNILSDIGAMTLFGQVNELNINSRDGNIDAAKLQSKIANVIIENDAIVKVFATELLNITNNKNGQLILNGKPKKITGMEGQKANDSIVTLDRINTRFIDIKLKTKGLKKLSCYVSGPKPNGKYFSYGLNLYPLVTKDEKWSIGTKLYKVGAFGKKQLIYTVKEKDEGQTIRL